MLKDLDKEGFLFRKSFANNIEQQSYTKEDFFAMFSQYKLVYGDPTEAEKEITTKILVEYAKNKDKVSEIKTNTKTFSINFDFNKTVLELVKTILESNIVLREQQIEVLNNTPIDIILKAFDNSNIKIKEIEVQVFKLFLNKDVKDLKLEIFFKDPDQIVRIIVSNFLYFKEGTSTLKSKILIPILIQGQINNKKIKNKFVKIPNYLKKIIVKSLNDQAEKNIEKTIEKMFKYHSFWKVILTAINFTTKDKLSKKYPNFLKLKDKLYKNDRSNTLNGKIESLKN